ncbi:MAG: hypothetical protein JW969_15125 [Spirochaetales bacterium]|nr:hypothetical protein [Spirochaetales bacterium]
MKWEGPERRCNERISVEKLPDALKAFMAKIGLFTEFRAETNSANKLGIGINFNFPFDEVKNKNHKMIQLHSLNGDFTLYGKIVHIHSKPGNICHMGIEFNDSKSLEKYNELLGNKN